MYGTDRLDSYNRLQLQPKTKLRAEWCDSCIYIAYGYHPALHISRVHHIHQPANGGQVQQAHKLQVLKQEQTQNGILQAFKRGKARSWIRSPLSATHLQTLLKIQNEKYTLFYIIPGTYRYPVR